MNWQMLAVIVLVAVASFYLLRQHWRTWTGSKSGGCAGGCSCPSKAAASANGAASPALIAPEQITLRRRNIGSP